MVSLHRKDTNMIVFDLRLGLYSILALREPDVRFGVQAEGRGEFTLALPYLAVTFTDHQKSAAAVAHCNTHNVR